MKHVIFDCDGTLVDTSGPKYKLFPGIQELLEKHKNECLYYVWTARGRKSTLKVLEDLGVKSYFEDFSTPDDGFTKPNPEGLKALVGLAKKDSICVIGDSSVDMMGAKFFKVLAIGAIWSAEANSSSLESGGADFLVSHPNECSKLIEFNLKGEIHV